MHIRFVSNAITFTSYSQQFSFSEYLFSFCKISEYESVTINSLSVSNRPICLFLAKFDPTLTSDDFS